VLEPEKLTFTSHLWGQSRIEIVPVRAETTCALSIMDRTNSRGNSPTYEVLVQSGKQRVTIDNCLSAPDQEWLANQIQFWVAARTAPAHSPKQVAGGEAAPGPDPSVEDSPAERDARPLSPKRPAASVAPSQRLTEPSATLRLEQTPESRGLPLWLGPTAELPPDSEIRIHEDEPDALCFTYPLRVIVPTTLFLWCAILYLIIMAGSEINRLWNVNGVVTSLIYLLPAAGFFLWWLYFQLGRGTVRLTRDQLECHWSSLGITFRSRMAVIAISGIQVGNLAVLRRAGTVHRPLPGDPESPGIGCGILGKDGLFRLARDSECVLSLEILGCILGKLQAWGVVQISLLPVDGAGLDSAAEAGEVIPGDREAASS
jgi:hypothetical protein